MSKKKLTKKSIILKTIIVLIAVSIIIGIYVLNKTQKIDKSAMSSELQRTQAYDDVKDGDNAVKDAEGNTIQAIKFDAFFLKDKDGDGIAESIRGTCNEIGSQASLYMELSVLEQGKLKDGKITINSNNFYFNTSIVKDTEVKENYISANTKEINFNEIGNGTQKLLIGSIRSGDYSSTSSKSSAIGNDTTKYSKENSVTFSGTFVDSDGNETAFSKDIPFTVDWYGETYVEIDPKNQTNNITQLDELVTDDGLELEFQIRTVENKNQLIMSSSEISGTIPELNGYKAKSVKISGTNITYTYDEETGKFTAQKTATLNTNGIVTSNAYNYSSSVNRYTYFDFDVIYPIEAYTALGTGTASFELAIPIQAVIKGYNNTNEEDGFVNPYISNTATGIVTTTWSRKVGNLYDFEIYVGKYMGSPYNTYVIQKKKPLNIYNGISTEEKDDTYLVEWRASTGENVETDGIVMNETTGKTDQFMNTSSKYESMENLTTNVGIYFSGVNNTLNSDGWIKVYDADTNTLIHTFTSKDWNSYTQSNPYKYENSIKHIRIETSSTKPQCYFYVYNLKELDDEYITTNYSREDFDNLSYIYSYLDGKMIKPKTDENEETTYCFSASEINKALYEAPTSVAKISIKDNTISTHVTAEHQKITITAETSGYNEQGWKNGTFLVQLPSEIILGEINEVSVNNTNVKITAYDIYEENDNYYIKILTESADEESFDIVIDCDLAPDPRITKTTKQVKLWAKNETACDYYYSGKDTYDVDGNSNTEELVNYRETSLTFDPGSSLSTTQVGSNYAEDGGVTIAPRVAKTDKGQRTATITISAINNYTYDIQDVKILGVVPFEGNKYVISGNDLGSTFTTYMNDGGLEVLTSSIKDKVTIYYSTTERPNKDLTDVSNGWKLAKDIDDWKRVKNYLIVLDNSYKLSSKESIEFRYDINLPNGVDYNKITYSEHAIYFALQTDEGLYYTATGSAKLGFMIAKQYDLEIVKYQKDTEKTLQGVTFSITEDGAESSSIKTTDKDGKLLVLGLYAERYYTIKEIKTTDDYVLNTEEIRFYTYTKINDDGTESLYLTYPGKEEESSKLSLIYKTTRAEQVNSPASGNDYRIQIKIDNEVKARLKINKTDTAGVPLKNIKFTLTGKEKDGEILTTDQNGDINALGLYLDQEYTLEEVKATGYYIPQTKIKFKITNNNGNFELNYTDNDTTKSKQLIINDEIPTLELNLQNEKIPTYGLQLTKYAKGEKDSSGNDKKLARAQYLIIGEGIKDGGKIYTTDENGILTIDNLYEYVDGKYIIGEYTLKEIYAPEGYSVDSTELKFKAYRENGTLKIQIIEGDTVIRKITVDGTEEKDINIKNATAETPVIEIGVEDGQIFSIYKYYQDGTSSAKKPIPGTRFKITDLNGNYVTGSDGKIVGEWFDTTQAQLPVPDITLSSTGTYQWTQRDDGTWESTGCYNVNSAIGTLTSNEFVLKQNATLQFEWTVSSESASYDYAYYTITNVETNKTVKGTGTSTKIGGTDNGTTYDSLKFLKVSLDLEPGKYKIEFTYRKDGSVNKGLDSAFVKNVGFEQKEVERTGYYAVTTDSNGQITANLAEGLYKAIEVYTNDRYILPEKEADRTYYFGIGASQAATWDWVTGLTGQGWNYVNSVASQKDGGVIAVGSFSKYSTDVVANAVDGVDIDNDGIVDKISEGSNDGLIISYDTDGKVVWAKTFGGDSDDSLHKVIQTSDGGYVAVGYAESNSVKYDGKVISELSRTSTDNLSQKDAILLKISKDGAYEWGLRIGGTGDDEIQSVIETSEGNFAITGKYYSSTFNFYDRAVTEVKETMTNTGERDAFVASYSSTGVYQWSSSIGGSGNQDAPDLTEYSAGIAVASNSSTSARISLYSLTGSTIKSAFSIGSGTSKITSLDTYTDGTIIAGVNYTGTQFDAGIYKVTTTGNATRIYELTGTYDEYVSDVQVTSDGGILFGGWYYSTDTAGSDGTTFEEKSGEYACDGYVIKLNSKNVVEYSSRLYGDNYDGVNSVTETRNGALASGGFFNSSTLSATNCEIEKDEEDTTPKEQVLTKVGNSEAFVILEGSAGAAVAEAQKIEVENKVKTFKITTEVKKNNNVAGGDIDGQTGVTIDGVEYTKDGIRYVEKVNYGDNSKNTIKITPETNYIIDSITINGKEYTNFTTSEDGTVTLPIFDNVLEDKHIVVQFSNTMSNIEVNHYLWTKDDGTTTIKVAETQTSTGVVGTTYETSPNTDIEYVIITNSDYYGNNLPEGVVGSDYYIPANYKGTYTEGTKEVINYYYKEKTYKLTVHHYLDGTTESVPLKGSTTGEKVADEITEDLKKNSEYTTTQAGDTKIDYSIYELVSIPENATGTIQEDTEVTYYYKIKTADIRITKVAEEDHEKTLANTQFQLYQYQKDLAVTDELIDINNVGSDWKLIGIYTTSDIGVLKLENLPVNLEYRLIETRPVEGRILPDGQWKIKFVTGTYDTTDTSIVTINGVPFKINAIGNPPAMIKTDDGKLLLPNKANYNFPTSGSIELKTVYQVGMIIIAIGVVMMALIVVKKCYIKNTKKIKKGRKH